MSFLSCFCYAFVHPCLLMPCGHLLGKSWPGSRLWCLIVKLSLSHWYPGSGVVLDCIDSWSLPSFSLRLVNFTRLFIIFSRFFLKILHEKEIVLSQRGVGAYYASPPLVPPLVQSDQLLIYSLPHTKFQLSSWSLKLSRLVLKIIWSET